MTHAEWLPIIMQNSFSEIYIVDCNTLHFVQVNETACRKLDYTARELASMIWPDIAPALPHDMLTAIRRGDHPPAMLTTVHTRKDGSTYAVECRVSGLAAGTRPVYIVIADDVGARHPSPSGMTEIARIEAAKESERQRIAHAIHDDLGSHLAALKMALAQVKKSLPPHDATLDEKVAYAQEQADRTIDAAQRISLDLRPGILDSGLVAALAWQAREFEKQSGIRCEFACDSEEISLHPDRAAALLRIVREALTNAGKHSQAGRVVLRLAQRERAIRLEIADDGAGIAAADRLKPHSFGIRGMTERAAALGGTLSVSAAPAGGTVVALSIPLPA